VVPEVSVVGEAGVPLRIGSPPEINLLTLKAG
jgi:predicted MPP superfamily phosphohydrolase